MKPLSAKYSKRESDLVRTSERIIDQMTGNPDYPDPPAELAELKKEVPVFQEVHVNALSGDKKQVSIKNDRKVIILALLQVLADYVTVKSNGDRTLILSSGFDVSNERRSNKNLPPSIEKLEVELGEAGVATIRTKEVTAVKAYIHQYTTEPPSINTVWVGDGSSYGDHTFSGLSSGKQYWFRVVAIGFKKQRAFSPVVSRFIQ
jgi:hypothetical protein